MAACPEGEEQAASTLVITATGTNAEPLPALPASVISELEQGGRTDQGCVLIVAPGGAATAVSLTPRRSTGDVEEGNGREILRRRVLAAVQDKIASLAATEPGLDVRGAIATATKLRHTPGKLIVITSGLSTVQPVDLRRLGWDVDGGTLGAFLHRQGWLDLTGWQVRFVGLGGTAGSQPRVPDPVKRILATLWTGICTATGGVQCTVTEGPTTRQEPRSHNTVPIVQPPAQADFPAVVPMPTDESFALDSAALSASADARLQDVVAQVLNDDLILSVVGYADASTGTPEHNLALSTARALAVKARLIALGLPLDRIVAAYGLGSTPFSAEAERQNPALKTQHRRVDLRFARRPPSA
jgi:outer membrane protein OmpA-like peptidoglycan-associated protein